MSGRHITPKSVSRVFLLAIVAMLAVAGTLHAQTHKIVVTVESLAPWNGFYFSPVWLGFHDGSFDSFDPGGFGGLKVERLAEDGDASVLQAEFEAAVGGDRGGVNTVLTAPEGLEAAPIFDPGDSASVEVDVDPIANRYMSYMSMVVPSNDAFIGNHDPHAIELFDAAGQFKGKKIVTVLGSMVWDAGTELNNEMDAAFLNQTDPNTGVTTHCPVTPHPGHIGSYGNPGGEPIALGATNPLGVYLDPVATDFTIPHAVVARITIEPVMMDGEMDQ